MRERWAPIGLGADGGATCAEDAGNFARKTCPGGRLVLSNAACFHDVTSWRDPFCWRTDLFHDFFFCVCACRTKKPGRIGTNAYGFGGEDSFASTGPSLERIDGYGKSWAAVSGVGMEGGLDYMKSFFFSFGFPIPRIPRNADANPWRDDPRLSTALTDRERKKIPQAALFIQLEWYLWQPFVLPGDSEVRYPIEKMVTGREKEGGNISRF